MPAPAEPTAELTPLQYLACADREWATGHHRQAAALLWKATKSTFIALAQERGLDYDELFIDLAKALEADGSVRKGYYRNRLGVAKLMRDHAELDVLEGIRLESAYCVAREFIVELHSDRLCNSDSLHYVIPTPPLCNSDSLHYVIPTPSLCNSDSLTM